MAYPSSISVFPTLISTDTMNGSTGGSAVQGDTLLNQIIADLLGIENLLGADGVNAVLSGVANTLLVPTGSGTGLLIKFQASSSGSGFLVEDHLGNPIGGVGSTGGWKTFGDRTQAAPGVLGPFLSLDGTTKPPSILSPPSVASSYAYGTGGRLWIANGTPASEWVSGTTQVNDLWYNFATGQWSTCTVSGAGTAAGTWIGGNGVNPIGKQVAYNAVTANFSNTSAAGGAFQQADTTSGTAPTITLPNDGGLYRIEFIATAWTCSVADVASIGIGTSPTNVLASTNSASLPTTNQFVPPLVIPQITGSGQVLKMYTECFTTGHTVTVKAAAAPGLVTPASLAAYRVG